MSGRDCCKIKASEPNRKSKNGKNLSPLCAVISYMPSKPQR